MQIRIDVSKLKELIEEINSIEQELTPVDLMDMLRLAVAPAVEAMKAAAPVRDKNTRVKRYKNNPYKKAYYIRYRGNLRRSIGVAMAKRPRKNTIWIGVGALRNRDVAKSAWYAHFLWNAPQMPVKNNFIEKGWNKVGNEIDQRLKDSVLMVFINAKKKKIK